MRAGSFFIGRVSFRLVYRDLHLRLAGCVASARWRQSCACWRAVDDLRAPCRDADARPDSRWVLLHPQTSVSLTFSPLPSSFMFPTLSPPSRHSACRLSTSLPSCRWNHRRTTAQHISDRTRTISAAARSHDCGRERPKHEHHSRECLNGLRPVSQMQMAQWGQQSLIGFWYPRATAIAGELSPSSPFPV